MSPGGTTASLGCGTAPMGEENKDSSLILSFGSGVSL